MARRLVSGVFVVVIFPERYRSGHNGTDSKSVGGFAAPRGFESLPLRQTQTVLSNPKFHRDLRGGAVRSTSLRLDHVSLTVPGLPVPRPSSSPLTAAFVLPFGTTNLLLGSTSVLGDAVLCMRQLTRWRGEYRGSAAKRSLQRL